MEKRRMRGTFITLAFALLRLGCAADDSPSFNFDSGPGDAGDVDADTDTDTDTDTDADTDTGTSTDTGSDAGTDTDTTYPLDELCGQVTDGTYCGASTSATCTSDASELAAAYCAIGGYFAAHSWESQTAGSWGPTWYYTSSEIPVDCEDLAWNLYGASELCPCVTELVCQ